MTDSVPALHRGLRLLETVAACGSIGFSQLLDRCGLPKATVARLLGTLRELGYLQQIDERGDYRLGERCRLLNDGLAQDERLRLIAAPHLAAAAEACANTLILLTVRQGEMTCIDRIVIEDSIVLQAPGSTRRDLGHGPWGSVALAAMHDDERERAIAAMKDPATWQIHAEADMAHARTHGWLFHDEQRPTNSRSDQRRLAVPIPSPDAGTGTHGPTALLGLGGTPQSLPDADIPGCVAILKATAVAIAAELPA